MQGLELIVESLPIVIKRIPRVKLIVIGTGLLAQKLKDIVCELRLEKSVEFKGFIADHRDVETILSKCGVGLAVYPPNPKSFTYYADPSKPKQYMACGLPVIVTRVPQVAHDIEKRGSGIVINYDKEALANAIIRLLTDDNLYATCRRNAIEFASEHEWSGIFDKAFIELHNLFTQ